MIFNHKSSTETMTAQKQVSVDLGCCVSIFSPLALKRITFKSTCARLAGWLVGWLCWLPGPDWVAGWLTARWLAGWLAGCVAGWPPGFLPGWLARWLACWLACSMAGFSYRSDFRNIPPRTRVGPEWPKTVQTGPAGPRMGPEPLNTPIFFTDVSLFFFLLY